MPIDVLVNKDNPLSKTYIPTDLIITDNNDGNFHNYLEPTLKPMVRKDIIKDFLIMQEHARQHNINIIIGSGYRSFDYQVRIFEENVKKNGLEEAKKYVALPGCSEHQTGLAIDIACFRNGKCMSDLEDNDNEIIWLMNNSYKYGFILRYPKNKEKITGISFESWHYRYVGIKLATFLFEYSLTLEEYYLKNDYYDNIINNSLINKKSR